MPIHLLPAEAEADHTRLLAIKERLAAARGAAARLHSWDTPERAGRIRWQVLAVTGDGDVVGLGDTGRDAGMETGLFWIYVAVLPAYRRQGIGTMLYDDVSRFAWELGATLLVSDAGAEDPESVAFLEHRGFLVECQLTEIATGEQSAPAVNDALAAVEAAGARLRVLAGARMDHDAPPDPAVSMRDTLTQLDGAYQALARTLDWHSTPAVRRTAGVYRLCRRVA
jgi:GNAT superfamily N-acetyltransferase